MNGDCPTGCGRNVKVGHLMCGACWGEVPKHLQTDVLRTWKAYRRIVDAPRPTDSHGILDRIRARTEARLAYRAACDAAVGSIA